jgi:hypothetical protein
MSALASPEDDVIAENISRLHSPIWSNETRFAPLFLLLSFRAFRYMSVQFIVVNDGRGSKICTESENSRKLSLSGEQDDQRHFLT